jgi:phosphoglycerate dehydrogenase-like enzyme
MKANKIKELLFYLAFVVIVLPLAEDTLHFIDSAALKGLVIGCLSAKEREIY